MPFLSVYLPILLIPFLLTETFWNPTSQHFRSMWQLASEGRSVIWVRSALKNRRLRTTCRDQKCSQKSKACVKQKLDHPTTLSYRNAQKSKACAPSKKLTTHTPSRPHISFTTHRNTLEKMFAGSGEDVYAESATGLQASAGPHVVALHAAGDGSPWAHDADQQLQHTWCTGTVHYICTWYIRNSRGGVLAEVRYFLDKSRVLIIEIWAWKNEADYWFWQVRRNIEAYWTSRLKIETGTRGSESKRKIEAQNHTWEPKKLKIEAGNEHPGSNRVSKFRLKVKPRKWFAAIFNFLCFVFAPSVPSCWLVGRGCVRACVRACGRRVRFL